MRAYMMRLALVCFSLFFIALLSAKGSALAQDGAGESTPTPPKKSAQPKKVAPKKTTPPLRNRQSAPAASRQSAPNIEMVYIPAGEFQVGSENGNADEKPVHRVRISNGFYMGKYEVTQGQWEAVMGNIGCGVVARGPTGPPARARRAATATRPIVSATALSACVSRLRRGLRSLCGFDLRAGEREIL